MDSANADAVFVTVSAPVGSGKSAVLTEIEVALKVAGCDVSWPKAERERHLISDGAMARIGLPIPRVVLIEHDSGSSHHWDAWWAGLPVDLKRKLSIHDFRRLGNAFKAAFLISWDQDGKAPTTPDT